MRKWIILVLLVILTTIYLYSYSLFSLDAVWNYGFAYNIANGLVPYRDYNMIITPMFPYLLSILIIIFGNKFILYYLLMSLIIVLITYFAYIKIGYKAIFIYFLVIVTSNIGYNVLALLLFFVLLYLLDNKNEKKDIWVAIIVSCMIFTKQTLGLLIIPSIIYSKKRKKIVIIYLISFLVMLLYLVVNNNIWYFLDYCFLGMFDFASNNSTNLSFLTLIELGICFILLLILIKGKFKNDKLCYILLFQIICFPIVDGVHFIITFVPILYYIFCKVNYKYINLYICLTILSFFLTFNFTQLDYTKDKIYLNQDSFMYGKRVPNYFEDYFNHINKYKNKYKGYKVFILEARSYVAKLELGMDINKFDIINDGNMGYNGSYKYIKEIDNYCNNNKCLFFIDYTEYLRDRNQISDEIVNYISKKYTSIISSSLDNVYIN